MSFSMSSSLLEEEELFERPLIQSEQAFPVPLRRGAIVGGALREREAVLDAFVELDLGRHAAFAQRCFERPQLRERRVVVGLGPGDVELGVALARGEVGTVGGASL